MDASPCGAAVEIPAWYVWGSNAGPLSGLRTVSGG